MLRTACQFTNAAPAHIGAIQQSMARLPFFAAAKKEGRPWLCTGLPISPMLRQLAKRKVGPWLRTALPISPMLRQLAKRKVGPWLRTALPISPMLRQLAKRKVGPWLRTALPISPMLRQLAWEPPKKANFQRFSYDSPCPPRRERVYSSKRGKRGIYFVSLFHLLGISKNSLLFFCEAILEQGSEAKEYFVVLHFLPFLSMEENAGRAQ